MSNGFNVNYMPDVVSLSNSRLSCSNEVFVVVRKNMLCVNSFNNPLYYPQALNDIVSFVGDTDYSISRLRNTNKTGRKRYKKKFIKNIKSITITDNHSNYQIFSGSACQFFSYVSNFLNEVTRLNSEFNLFEASINENNNKLLSEFFGIK